MNIDQDEIERKIAEMHKHPVIALFRDFKAEGLCPIARVQFDDAQQVRAVVVHAGGLTLYFHTTKDHDGGSLAIYQDDDGSIVVPYDGWNAKIGDA